MSNVIEDAKIISEETTQPVQEQQPQEQAPINDEFLNADDELLERLKQATETKEPTASNPVWNFDLEDEPVSENKEVKPTQTTTTTTPVKEPVKELSKKAINANAKLTVTFLESLVTGGGNMYLNRKFKKKFTKEEYKFCSEELIYVPKDVLTEPQLALRNKFKSLEEKRKQKERLLPFNSQETEQLVRIFAEYSEATGQEMPAWLTACLSASAIIIKRLEIFAD